MLDPFCGCGTAVAAAQKLGRKWIGIDVTHLSISLMKYRLKDMFGLAEKQDYAVLGEPEDLESAHALARSDRYQFQWWALSLVQAKPLGGEAGREGRKGSDKGVDGVLSFMDEKDKLQRVLVQVKSGHVKSGDVRDLRGVVEREQAAMGVFITLEAPSSDMLTEAVSAGYFTSRTWQKDYPCLQILTIEELLAGKGIEMPPSAYGTFKQAGKVKKADGRQGELGIKFRGGTPPRLAGHQVTVNSKMTVTFQGRKRSATLDKLENMFYVLTPGTGRPKHLPVFLFKPRANSG